MRGKFLVIVFLTLILCTSIAIAKKHAGAQGHGTGDDTSKGKLHIYIFGSNYEGETTDPWTNEGWVLYDATNFDLRVTNTDKFAKAYHTTLVVAVYPPVDGPPEVPDDITVSITSTDGQAIGPTCIPISSDYKYSDDPAGDNGWQGFGKHGVFSQGAWYFLCDLNPDANAGLGAPYEYLNPGGAKDDIENGLPGNPDPDKCRIVHVTIDPKGVSDYKVHFDAVAFDIDGNFIMKDPFSHSACGVPEVSLMAALGIIFLTSSFAYLIVKRH